MPAAYVARLAEFLKESPSIVLASLVRQAPKLGFQELKVAQVPAWEQEIKVLQDQLSVFSDKDPHAQAAGILLEFSIPRRQKRIDATLLFGNLVFVIEFKTGAISGGARQAEDYAMDLADFHLPSRESCIFPIVVGSKSRNPEQHVRNQGQKVFPALEIKLNELSSLLSEITSYFSTQNKEHPDPQLWNRGEYKPVPTIIDAACALYAGSDVREIANSGASRDSLDQTTQALLRAISDAEKNLERVICFVTGVPGAGKTLVGLNSIHNRNIGTRGIFLSGNGPLVKILREALARDQRRREKKTMRESRRGASVFIQNMHDFVRNHFGNDAVPCLEHVIAFDEAQRAWNSTKNKKKIGHEVSEPEIVLSIMDKLPDWSAVIALIGGGQEIHDGEAGLAEWGRALSSKFKHWKILLPDQALRPSDSTAGSVLFSDAIPASLKIESNDQLHLPVSIRTIRSENVTSWVNRVLSADCSGAAQLAKSIGSYPLMITRSLETAKQWLRDSSLGSRRFGLIGSSGAARLRAYGIEQSEEFQSSYPFHYWFLNDANDFRSCYQLEVMATEFKIQGLELDKTCVCWGGDFLWDSGTSNWKILRLKGTTWAEVKSPETRNYILNKYRVLMTRARDGLVIWIPEGDAADSTRDCKGLNETAEYFLRCGAKSLDEGGFVSRVTASGQ